VFGFARASCAEILEDDKFADLSGANGGRNAIATSPFVSIMEEPLDVLSIKSLFVEPVSNVA
jgi:hypothetical protein